MQNDLFLDFGTAHINKKGEELCGDMVLAERMDGGVILVLSDGLGSGVKANILSTLTAKIAITMLKNNSPIEEVVNTIVKTLPVCKTRNLAYSTFTMLKILKDGRGYIAMFDTPKTIFKTHHGIDFLSGREVIIAGKRVIEKEFQMKESDMIVAISDGVEYSGVGLLLSNSWGIENIKYYIGKLPDSLSALSVSKKIITTCEKLYESKPSDDSTAISIKYVRPKYTTIFTGPPIKKEDDSIVVEKLMSSSGKKIVCGGTTGQIVARELNRNLKIEMYNLDSDIPPVAYIKGVDLVTEGVITLNKVLSILREYKDDYRHLDDLFKEKEENGIYIMLKILLDDSTHIKILMGRRINPAHEELDFPEDLSSKMDLIKGLKVALEDLGKIVDIEYF